MFAFILNYFKNNKTAYKSNPRTHSPQQSKKSRVEDNCLFQSLYFREVAETIKSIEKEFNILFPLNLSEKMKSKMLAISLFFSILK